MPVHHRHRTDAIGGRAGGCGVSATRPAPGRLLLDALLAACATAGARQVIPVIADTRDPASLALHRACGFADAERLREVGHKHGRRIDTVLLQREVGRGGASAA